MAQVTIQIDDTHVDRVRATVAARLGIDITAVGLLEVRAYIVTLLKAAVKSYETEAARDAAEASQTDITAD